MRWLWWLLAWSSVVVGVIGIVVPGLPTVPFMLLAAYAAARGSSRLHDWLLAHRHFGPIIRDWRQQGVVRRRSKWQATVMMSLAACVLFLTAPKAWMAGIGTACMTLVALWLWRRPEPRGSTPLA